MHEALQLPTRTRDVRAVDRGLILIARYRCSTHRAVVRHSPRFLAAGALVRDRRDDLRNHLAGPLHLHPIALTKILGDDEILVVQCRQLHDHAADLDRLELSVWIQRAGSTYVDLDFEQSGFGDIRGKFSRDRPSRLASADDAHLFLKAERIHFDDAAVDGEVQLASDLVLQLVRPLLDLGERLRALPVRRHRDAPFRQRVQQLRLSLEWQLYSVGRGERIAKESERPGSRNCGIELSQASRRGVARVGEKGFAGARPGLVHLLEAIEGEVNLAPNLNASFGRALPEAQRNVAHGPEVHRHVLTDGSIAARRTHHEKLILVGERDGDAINLELRGVARLCNVVARYPHQPLFPGAQLLVVEGIGEREHRPDVLVFGKLALGLCTDPQSWRIRRYALRKISLQLLELAKELVVRGVRDRRTIQNVVVVGCAVEQAAQLAGALKLELVGFLPSLWSLWVRLGWRCLLR